MPLPTCSVSLPVSERPFSAWSSPTAIHRSNVASDATRDAHLRAFKVANYRAHNDAHNDANFVAKYRAWSDASNGANRDAHLHAFGFANFQAIHDAKYAANFHASSDASTGAFHLQTSMPIIVPW
jgi:hypothetical protein